jgi:hypothetical protein
VVLKVPGYYQAIAAVITRSGQHQHALVCSRAKPIDDVACNCRARLLHQPFPRLTMLDGIGFNCAHLGCGDE